MTRSNAGGAAVLAALTLAAAGCGGGRKTTSPTTTIAPSAAPYTLAATRACLASRGVAVRAVRPNDAHLRALRDAAQRTSVEALVDGKRIGLAIPAQAADVQLLADVLAPVAPYRLETAGNALLLFRPDAAAQARVVRGCLGR